MATRALLLAPPDTVEDIYLEDSDYVSLRQLQEACGGGYVEAYPIGTTPPMVMWANEDGRARDLPPNDLATILALPFLGQMVLGPVVITGGATPSGGVRPIPEKWRKTLVQGLVPHE